MLSIRRESLEASGSGVRESLPPPGEVVQVCRNCDAIPHIPASKRMLRVLVVDDSRDAADSLSRLVNLWGNDARTAYDGAAALEMAVALNPHVVLLDLSMPKMDGCQVARQLRQQTAFADTLLIATTGWTDQAHRLLCDEVDFDHYLIKPIDLDRLKILLRERRRLTQSAEDVEKANETSRNEDEFREESPIPTAHMKTEVLPCWS
ncbi:MAG TPA: response regulator [Gemmataceae bacterium]|jgi:CheY-like chemotaxis protein